MTFRFPETPTFTGYDAPMRIECDIRDLEVDGELPPSLNGSWYRVGPDPAYPPIHGDDLYINGDGMMSLLRICDGKADFRSRYVQTERLKAQRAARRGLFGNYRNSYTNDPEAAGVSNGTANTTAMWHAGRLLALKEDSLPYQLDPDTLATIGLVDWSAGLRTKTFTAHPKVDPDSGALHAFAYEAEGDGSSAMAYVVIDAEGQIEREVWFEPPYIGMVHDFAITAGFAIFPVFPTIMDPDRLKAKGAHWVADASRESWVGILPRDATPGTAPRWFKRPVGGHAYHIVNAFEEGGLIHLDLAVSEINSFPGIADVSGAPYDPPRGAPIPMRWTFDPTRNDDGFEERPLAPIPGDLPRIDDRRIGKSYRRFFMGMIDPSRAMPKAGPVGAGFNMLGSVDVTDGSIQAWYGDDRTTFQEPTFVPNGPGEDDGHVLCVMDRHDENRADIGVFIATAIGAGPIATIRLPIRLRLAFHGCWVSSIEHPALPL